MTIKATLNCPLFVIQSEKDLQTRLNLATHAALIAESSLCSHSLLEIVDTFVLPTLVLLEKEEHLGLIESFEFKNPLLIDVISIDLKRESGSSALLNLFPLLQTRKRKSQ